MRYPNIDAERARKRMSVDSLVKELGVCKKTYYNWLKRGKIPAAMLERMADMFGCSADYLLGLKDKRASA